jgi:hypothetical protein
MGGLGRGWEHDQENNMNETTHNVVPAPVDTLHAELRALIASSRQRLAGAVNASFPDAAIVSTLSTQLS